MHASFVVICLFWVIYLSTGILRSSDLTWLWRQLGHVVRGGGGCRGRRVVLAAERRLPPLLLQEVEVLVGGDSAAACAALPLSADAAASAAADEAALGLGLLDEAGDLGGDEAAVAAARAVVGHARGAVLCKWAMLKGVV